MAERHSSETGAAANRTHLPNTSGSLIAGIRPISQEEARQQQQRADVEAAALAANPEHLVDKVIHVLQNGGEQEHYQHRYQQQQREDGARVNWSLPPRPLHRQEGMSDLWQTQGAFRSNRQSMKAMFKEFTAELESAANAGRSKAEINDIFSFTLTGLNHIERDIPAEDRIAIHQAVVPTIDEETKEELGIDGIDTTPFAMFAVFDGHGGTACAEFLTQSVGTVLAHSPVLYDEDLTPVQRRARATADSFEELEKIHNTWARENSDMSGSTAILSTFEDGILVMAGVGDSAGLYVDHLGNSHTLCPKHSTSNAKEVQRVTSMGGTIINNRVAGVLMPTRTIGDLDCKIQLGAIVSPHPELNLAAIYAPPDDGEEHDEPFLVLASDGLWDVLSNDEVAYITRRGLRSLRASQAKELRKQEKAEAKALKKHKSKNDKNNSSSNTSSNNSSKHNTDNDADGAGTSSGRFWKKKSDSKASRSNSGGSGHRSGTESSDTFPPANDEGGFPAPTNGFMDGSRRTSSAFPDPTWGNHKNKRGDEYLDLSRGLDASVREGVMAGPSATLDSSLYHGMRADGISGMEESLKSRRVGGGLGSEAIPARVVAVNSTRASAGVRTAGSSNENVAMQLAHAALRSESTDDISVVVVTFQASKDRSAPGSRRAQRRRGN